MPEAGVRVPLRMMNRHGLIAGATGTGKTRTLQVIAEQLSAAGVAVFAADVKGDVSGIALPGSDDGPAKKRARELGIEWAPAGFPVEYLSLGGIGPGVPVRATVSDFGPLLLAKVLGSNQTQEQSLTLVFHYADQKGLPLLDLSDLRALLTFLDSDDGQGGAQGHRRALSTDRRRPAALARRRSRRAAGTTSSASRSSTSPTSSARRRTGAGSSRASSCPAVQDKPQALVDRAHVDRRRALRDAPGGRRPRQAEARLLPRRGPPPVRRAPARRSSSRSTQTVRLIRSKGVGVFFVTQTPKDIPADVLGQLGNRVQHALRAFTPDDAKALRATVRTFPKSDFYDLEELLTQIGTGEAAVTILSESGVPDARRAHAHAAAAGAHGAGRRRRRRGEEPPRSTRSTARVSTAESAREMLAERLEQAGPPPTRRRRPSGGRRLRRRRAAARTRSATSSSRRPGRTIQRELVRGLFGLLKQRI